MSHVKKQLEKNKKSRNKQNEWFTPTNERNSYQSYRDTFLNYLYHKKKTSSNPHRKKLYKKLFELLRENPEKNADIYINILNKIEDIRKNSNSKTSSYIYNEFMQHLEKIYNKYKNNPNNFSNKFRHKYLEKQTEKVLDENLNTIKNRFTRTNESKLNEFNVNDAELEAYMRNLNENSN